MTDTHVRIAHAVACELLRYPRPVPLWASLRTAAAHLPLAVAEPMVRGIDRLAVLARPEAYYAGVFDGHRSLNLTYYSHGETRERGAALLRFSTAYHLCGFVPRDGELDDHLAVVLEFSGAGHTAPAVRLLRTHRASLEALRRELAAARSPYEDIVAAVCRTLPRARPRDLSTAARYLRDGPPREEIGRT